MQLGYLGIKVFYFVQIADYSRNILNSDVGSKLVKVKLCCRNIPVKGRWQSDFIVWWSVVDYISHITARKVISQIFFFFLQLLAFSPIFNVFFQTNRSDSVLCQEYW